jgi:hypothetical protein
MEGDPLELLWIDESGERLHQVLLGPLGAGARGRGAGRLLTGARPVGGYALVACTVGPGAAVTVA